ncbi:MAG: AAA family ATPase [Pirellulales bacterium]
MKILRLEIEGYRSLKSQTWMPGDLNLVIGPNGSGKSNLLSVLEMLVQGARGGLGKYVQREGGMEPLLWDGCAEKMRARAKMSPIPPYRDELQDALTYELDLERLGTSSAYRISYEVLGNYCKVEQGLMDQPFKLLERDPRHAVIYSMEERSFVAPPDLMSEEESLLSVAGGPFAPNRFAAGFRDELESWAIYQGFHTHREAPIRQAAVARAEKRVQPDGQNLISVLHTLYTGDREFKEEVNTAMRAAFSDDFEELIFPPAADQRIQLRVRWKSLQRERSAADLSDGTLRFLFLLAVLANPSPPALIAIDEPETGLHPSMLPIVAEFARDAANRAQVILTTHSPELLDAFGRQAPTTTVVEWREGQTQLRVLAGDQLDYWLKKYTLGELYRSRELETMT